VHREMLELGTERKECVGTQQEGSYLKSGRKALEETKLSTHLSWTSVFHNYKKVNFCYLNNSVQHEILVC
jgi:hypothetical protein